MLGMHARVPKHFVLEERLERYADAIEIAPAALAGRWREACAPIGSAPFARLAVDLGCGKGPYLAASARRDPQTLFVGIDGEPVCIAYAAQRVIEGGLGNALLVPALGNDLVRIFAPGEIDELIINFPTPFPRKKDAPKRLVALERLLEYRTVLAPDGRVVFKTDHEPLFAFAREQFELAGYHADYVSDDYRSDFPDTPASEYEERLVAQGAKVHAIIAHVGELAEEPVQTEPPSLVDYLPENLKSLEYVPYGMRGTVVNLINRRKHEEARRARSKRNRS